MMMLLETYKLLPLLRGTYRKAHLRCRASPAGLGSITHKLVRVWSKPLSGSRVAYSTNDSSSGGAIVSTDTYPSKCVVLSDLSYIAVTGTDARRFLQGICTNDISKLKSTAGDCVATSLLNNKGRILFNLILYTMRDKSVHSSEQQLSDDSSSVDVSDGLLAELHTHNTAEFQRYLSLYKLRSKVDIRVVEADCLFINSTFSTDQLASINDCSPDVLVAAIDPRLEGFGTRVVINKHALHSLSPSTKALLHVKGCDDESADSRGGGDSRLVRWYHRYKTLRGVLDGPEALAMIPFECNLDALNYVSFSKGCYIGQELMARTKFKGVVRKRLLPFIYSVGGGHIEDLQREVLSEDYDGVGDGGVGSLSPQQQSERRGPALGDAIYLSQHEASPREGYTDTDSSDGASSVDKPVGKVVYLDSTGTVGLAMMQLSAVATSSSDKRSYQLIAGTREVTSTAADVLDPNNTEAAASHIHLQLPSWFHRLDRVSGNIH